MNFSAWAIRKPIPSILLFALLCVAGVVGYRKLPVQHLPDLDFPMVVVTAVLPGATPSTLETEVTRRIEDSVSTVGSVRHIYSTVNDGTSVTTIEFDLEKNLQEAVSDVRNAVDRVRNKLPPEMQDPIISRVNTTGGAILTFAVESEAMDEVELSWFVDNDVGKVLLAVDGVGEVARLGGVDREIRVELDPTRLLALGVSAADVSAQVRLVQQEAPGGRTNLGGLEQSVRTSSPAERVEDLAALPIALTDGRAIRLDAVARVRDTTAEPRQAAYVDGRPVVSFQITRSRGASEVAVAARVRAKVGEIVEAHPHVAIREVNNTIEPVLSNYDAAMHSLYEGAFLAVVVVFFFLRDWRATFVSAVALPLSVIPTFAVIAMLGFQLNSITLLALTLIIGVLVDDAIVEIENIERHLRGGKSPRNASLEAANEIGLAVIATSLTLVAVFLPTAFMGGIAGKFFKQFGWTASIAVLFSLLVARLLTPMMAAVLMKPRAPDTAHDADGRLMTLYLRAVRTCLRHPFKTMAGAMGFLIASVSLLAFIPTNFVDAEDQNQILVTVEAPPGSTIENTILLAEHARRIVAANPEVRNVYTTVGAANAGRIGGSGGSAAEVRRASLVVSLVPANERDRSQVEIERALRARFAEIPGARLGLGGNTSGQQVMLVLAGDDQRLLIEATRRIMADLRTLPGLGNVSSTASLLRPELVVQPDFARAAELGVSTAAISQAVRVATTSDYDQNLPRLNLPNRQLYIRTQLPQEDRSTLETIRHLRVTSVNGPVPLASVARIAVEGGPAQIDRIDRSRNVTIVIETEGRPIGEINKQVEALESLRDLPSGIRRVASGESEQQAELFGGFGLAMGAGVFCVYAVLVLLFHDFLQPITILTALPLSVGGAFAALAICGYSLSLSSLIGLIMLMGIVTKNSILLVEYAIMARDEHGLSRTEALVDACHKRARPIIMTTFAMIAGMMPMALQLGVSSAFRGPMALAVMGGLITSTALSLLVVPVVFELVDEFKLRLKRRFRTSESQPAQLGRSAAGGAKATG
ncbi:MAG: efflux RND transporter permease subunit [Opitutaceae bacterium]|nr:efflux RND transporter permease subunit [Opitutaceae bacterium]